MSKINVLVIVVAHFRTVCTGTKAEVAKDIFVFLVLPGLVSVFFYLKVQTISDDLRALFVTVFSVFSALLFSAQIGLFALRRDADFSHLGDIERSALEQRDRDFNGFLKEFSTNTSYLILLSALELFLFVLEHLSDSVNPSGVFSKLIDAAIIFVAVHFFLTLLMALKRFYAAYEVSY